MPFRTVLLYILQHIRISINSTCTPACDQKVVTGWRRCIACLKMQFSFRKRATDFEALWREMTCIDKASYDATPLCKARHCQI